MRITVISFSIIWTFLKFSPVLHAGLPLESAGLRTGFPVNDAPDFRQVEAFADFQLPFKLAAGTNWLFQTRLDAAAGWLGVDNANGFIGSAGPSLILSRANFPVSLDFGSSPTILSRVSYPDRNFGVSVQFTTHLGLDWDVTRHVRVGYRVQHMSNAGLSHYNEGLNLHMFTVSWRF